MNKKQLLARLRNMKTLLHQAEQLVEVAIADLAEGISFQSIAAEHEEANELPIQPQQDLSTSFTKKGRWSL